LGKIQEFSNTVLRDMGRKKSRPSPKEGRKLKNSFLPRRRRKRTGKQGGSCLSKVLKNHVSWEARGEGTSPKRKKGEENATLNGYGREKKILKKKRQKTDISELT